MSAARVCLVPRLSGVGGMVSFQHRLAAGLAARGLGVCYDLDDRPYQAVLVVGGTRRLGGLWQAARAGIPLVQRLDGMNWVHRVPLPGGGRRTDLRHYLRAEYGNWLLSFIRSRLAKRIVYQSEFSRRWWESVYGPAKAACSVVYNGVDLQAYSPHGLGEPPLDRCRLLLVEGSLMGGYEAGLEVAVRLAGELAVRLEQTQRPLPVELLVVGRVAPGVRQTWERRAAGIADVSLTWAGLLPPERIPELDRSAHLLYSADVNAACPNSVIEALACGLPVISFDSGALPELVSEEAGRIAPYGGDPWRLETPDVPALAQAALEILDDQERFRTGARRRAEAAFSLDAMVEGYLQALLGIIS